MNNFNQLEVKLQNILHPVLINRSSSHVPCLVCTVIIVDDERQLPEQEAELGQILQRTLHIQLSSTDKDYRIQYCGNCVRQLKRLAEIYMSLDDLQRQADKVRDELMQIYVGERLKLILSDKQLKIGIPLQSVDKFLYTWKLNLDLKHSEEKLEINKLKKEAYQDCFISDGAAIQQDNFISEEPQLTPVNCIFVSEETKEEEFKFEDGCVDDPVFQFEDVEALYLESGDNCVPPITTSPGPKVIRVSIPSCRKKKRTQLCEKSVRQRLKPSKHNLTSLKFHSNNRKPQPKRQNVGTGGSEIEQKGVDKYLFFECKDCGRRFAKRSRLELHSVMHQTDHPGFPCPEPDCDKVLTTRLALSKHASWHRRPSCRFCMKALPMQSAIKRRRHEYRCNPTEFLIGKPFLCDICYNGFESQEALNPHREMHERCKCKICNSQCSTKMGLRIHMRAHFVKRDETTDSSVLQQETQHTCLACPAIFEGADALKKHYAEIHQVDIIQTALPIRVKNIVAVKPIRTKRANKPNVQNRSAVGSPSRAKAKRKQNTGPFTCEECGKTYKSNHILKSHKYVHLQDHKGFCCEICGEVLKTPVWLEQHIYRLHKRTSKPKTRKKVCEYCGKYLGGLRTERLHLYNHHREEYLKDKPFYCGVCCAAFKTQEELDKDFQRHPKCQFCDRRFCDKFKLSEHENIHTSNQPHQCNVCGKRFNHHNNLHVHKMIHTGERPFHCDVCPEKVGFFRKKHLDQHMSKCHS